MNIALEQTEEYVNGQVGLYILRGQVPDVCIKVSILGHVVRHVLCMYMHMSPTVKE